MSVELTVSQLDAECGDLLPAREALGVINVAPVAAVNVAAAVNVLSIGGAGAYATQAVIVAQS